MAEGLYSLHSVLALTALAMAVAVAVWAVADLVVRRRARGLWAAVLLLAPIPIAVFRLVEPSQADPVDAAAATAYWLGFAGVVDAIVSGSLIVLVAAVVWRDRARVDSR